MARRLDDLQNGCRIYQDPAFFCFGIDAVLLAHFASVRRGERVLDLGTGTGVIPLIMQKDAPETVRFDGLELIAEVAAMAGESVRLNGLEERIRIVRGDLREIAAGRAIGPDPAAIKPESYDVVTCNPPYYRAGSGYMSGEAAKAAARHELFCTLDEVIGAAAAALKSSGRFYMIHIPERLTEITGGLGRHGFEAKAMRFVHPRVDKEPTMVLIEAVKGGKPGLKVGPPLIVYEKDGSYTREIHDIYGG